MNVIGPSDSVRVRVAESPIARLRGLAFRDDIDGGLLIPRCRSVHTFGMRFAIDVVFLEGGRVVAVREGLGPRRFARARGATATLELPAGAAARLGLRAPGTVRFGACARPSRPTA